MKSQEAADCGGRWFSDSDFARGAASPSEVCVTPLLAQKVQNLGIFKWFASPHQVMQTRVFTVQ